MSAPIKRGCGFRIAGGAYLVTGMSVFGSPVENFIVDPPRPVELEKIGLAAIGVMPFKLPRSEETHVMNWVGEQNYPNPADFVEEVRKYGASTRVPKSFDFSLLKEGAYIYHVHSHAWIENYRDYIMRPPELFENPDLMNMKPVLKGCPSGKHGPDDLEMCARLWWQDVWGGVYNTSIEGDRSVRRASGDTLYNGFTAPREVEKVDYRPAVFFRLPVHRVEVVRDPARNSHEETLEKAWYADLEVREVDF